MSSRLGVHFVLALAGRDGEEVRPQLAMDERHLAADELRGDDLVLRQRFDAAKDLVRARMRPPRPAHALTGDGGDGVGQLLVLQEKEAVLGDGVEEVHFRGNM